MLLDHDRNTARRIFFDTWRKYQANELLEPLEQQLVHIILMHPEYHGLLNHPEQYLEREYFPEMGETNPFLHMALHMSIVEQISTDRPAGITALYQELLAEKSDPHEVEHGMMECLAEMLWQAQRSGKMIEEKDYLDCLKPK